MWEGKRSRGFETLKSWVDSYFPFGDPGWAWCFAGHLFLYL